ncbi:MAG: hypothetical protein OT477_11040 [Chloroflexi bacterium]|nr:hypothetical protein [Chloroflexota bacterium]
MSDDYDSYDSYDDYDDYDDAGGEEYDEEDGGAYNTTEFDLDNLAGRGDAKAAVPPKGGKAVKAGNSPLRLILGGLVALLAVIALVVVVVLPRLSGGGDEPTAEIAVATLIPTAAIVLPNTPTPEPSPTPTLAPPSAVFIAPSTGVKLTKGETVNIEIQVQDGNGITSVSLEGSGLAPKTFSGEPAVTFSQSWAPENAGFYTFAVMIRNRLGETNRVEGISVQVVDRDFIQRNAAVFSTLDANVAVVRGLSLREPIEPVLMGVEGVKRYYRTEYSPEDAQRDMLVMSSFDFVPRGFNLYDPAVEYSGNSIAGFYDSATKLFVLVSTDNEMDTYEQYVYVHELMHALQDQHFSLSDLGDTAVNQNSDAAFALRALAEGEAMLLQEQYLEGGYFGSAERADIQNISEIRIRTINQAQSRSQAPAIWGRLFYFPYEDGLTFARAIYNRGGWAGLTEAWGNPPVSTEQILHPDQYFAGDVPQAVSVPDLLPTLGEGWEEIDRTTLGELHLREYLGQRLDGGTLDTAATGWGGDQYAVYWNEPLNRVVMTLRLAWDSTADSDEFAAAYSQYADLAYGSAITEVGDGIRCRTAVDTVCTYRQGDDWLIVRATSLDLATAAMAAMQGE